MRKFLFIAVAGLATSIFIRSPSAQNVDQAEAAQSAMEQAVTGMGVRSPAAAHDKADAAMTTPKSPPTEADKKAATAMSK